MALPTLGRYLAPDPSCGAVGAVAGAAVTYSRPPKARVGAEGKLVCLVWRAGANAGKAPSTGFAPLVLWTTT